jgi:tetratricopeptide (TPR) repeat protein
LESDIKVDLGHGKLTWSGTIAKQSLERPMETDRNFDWSSAQGLFITADELAKQRYYGRAMSGLMACLKKEPYYLPALSRTAELYFRRGEYKTALKYTKKALAVSTYDPEANFIYGAAQKQMGRTLDAKDGFGWAARSMALRSAAYNQLAAVELKENHLERARYYAVRSLDFNRRNLESYKILAVAARLENKTEEARKTLLRIEAIDPLDHFVRFETYLLEGGDKSLDQFKTMIQNELPQETYLELALKYVDIGRIQEGISVLKEAPSHPVIHLWLAYLTRNTAEQDSCKYLDRALKASPYLVFPFRLETITALEWVIGQNSHWKAKYYLGLLFWNLGRTQEAGKLFQSCQNIPDYSTFYLARAELLKSTVEAGSTLNDIQRSIKIDPNNWRAWRAQTRHYLASNYPKPALKSAAAIQKNRPQDYILAMDLAKALIQNNQFKKSLDILTQTNILPYEGAREGHDLYRQSGLLYALSRLKDNAVSSALALVQKARQWPENLGAGKPYDTDERLEDYVAALCYEKTGKLKNADNLHMNIIKATRKYRNRWGAGHYISALVLRKKGKAAEAEKLLSDWIKARPGNNAVARWAAAKFHNLDEKASAILKQMTPEGQGTPWNPGGQDNDFPIVLSISRMN